MQSLSTAESIVVDGANGVTNAPREHFPAAGWGFGLGGLALIAALVLLKRGQRWALPIVLTLAAIPGLVHVLILRDDAPMARVALANTIARTLGELQQKAPWPRVNVIREDDDVMFPLSRYAVPGRKPVTGDAVELETRGALLGQPCRTEQARVICGAGP